MVSKDFYKKLFECKILTAKELNKLLELFGVDSKHNRKVKQRLVRHDILKRVKLFGKWFYVANTKKLQKLFKEDDS